MVVHQTIEEDALLAVYRSQNMWQIQYVFKQLSLTQFRGTQGFCFN